MELDGKIFDIEMPVIVDTEDELTIDDIESERVATPEEQGVATLITNSIADTWQKINDYNSMIATISSSGIINAEEIITIIKEIVDEENKTIGKLMSILQKVSPSTDNVDVGKEEATMKLTEDFTRSKADILSDVLGKSISSSEENYIYDGWRAFYKDPESFSDTVVVDLVNKGLKDKVDSLPDSSEPTELDVEDEEELDDGEQVVVDDDFIDESLVEKLEKNSAKKTHRIGTPQYDANEGRKKRIEQYRKWANVDEDTQLTENMLNEWAIKRVACFNNRPVEQIKNEILGKKWSDFEE